MHPKVQSAVHAVSGISNPVLFQHYLHVHQQRRMWWSPFADRFKEQHRFGILSSDFEYNFVDPFHDSVYSNLYAPNGALPSCPP